MLGTGGNRVQRQLLGIGNSLKAMGGEYRGLRDPALMRQLETRDTDFRYETLDLSRHLGA